MSGVSRRDGLWQMEQDDGIPQSAWGRARFALGCLLAPHAGPMPLCGTAALELPLVYYSPSPTVMTFSQHLLFILLN
jgi:hypothetical protein